MSTLCTILVACWLLATTLLASVAHASKMSFLGWFLIGLFLPAILLALLARYGRERLRALPMFHSKLVHSRT